jgi:hypothetical protein
LVNAARTAEYRLTEVSGRSAALIDVTTHPDAKADKLAKEFPKDTWFEVYDYGVGDEVVFPHRVSVTRTGPNMFSVEATAKVTMTLPANYEWELGTQK